MRKAFKIVRIVAISVLWGGAAMFFIFDELYGAVGYFLAGCFAVLLALEENINEKLMNEFRDNND